MATTIETFGHTVEPNGPFSPTYGRTEEIVDRTIESDRCGRNRVTVEEFGHTIEPNGPFSPTYGRTEEYLGRTIEPDCGPSIRPFRPIHPMPPIRPIHPRPVIRESGDSVLGAIAAVVVFGGLFLLTVAALASLPSGHHHTYYGRNHHYRSYNPFSSGLRDCVTKRVCDHMGAIKNCHFEKICTPF